MSLSFALRRTIDRVVNILKDPPEIPAVAGKEQWKRLSSKWNQKYNLPASSRQKRRPQSSHASHRGEEPHYPHSDYHMGTAYTPQSSGRWNEGGRSQRSQSSQRSQRPTWREEASAKRQQPAPALVSHLSTERSNKKTPTEKERFFRSIESENWQVTPDIIKENLECDRLLRTASWEAQAAETALTMQRFVESDQHMQRANKLQEAAESLSDELFSRSKTRYPGMTTMKHDYTIREPLLHAGGYSRPFNADCLDPMKTML